MTTNNIIELVASYLQLDDVLLYLEDMTGEHADSVIKTYNSLKTCVGTVYSQIASDLLPLITLEDIVCTDSRFDISALSKRVIDIVSIVESEGKVDFKVYPTYVLCELASDSPITLSVKYTYLPDFPDIATTDLEDFYGKMTPRTFAYGVAAEYSLISGMYEEANIWDKRFKESVLAVYHKKREMKIPPRRWL